MNITIERVSVDDTLKLIETRNKSVYDDFIKFGECPGYNIPLDAMEKNIQNACIYKIIVDGEIVGDISVHRRKEDMHEEGLYWIGCLEIIPEFQNKGIGSKALSYIQEQFPEAKRWSLETPVQNYRNCRFYEKIGFVKVEDKIHSEKLTLRIYEKTVK